MKQLVILCLLFATVSALMLPAAQALALSYYGVKDTINEDLTVGHEITLQFDSPISRLTYELGFAITNLSVEKNFDAADCRDEETGTGSRIVCDFVGMTAEKNLLKLLFTSTGTIREVDTHYQYAANYGISLPVQTAFTLIRLPKNGILTEEGSYAPADGKVLTDGKYIMVFWNAANLTSGNNLQFSVDFGLPVLDTGTSLIVLYSITGTVIIVLAGLLFYSRRHRRVEQAAELLTAVLNEDEKTVVEIVRQAGGKVGQKIIVRESGFSKAKVSRLVKSLKARNVLDTEPISGRENRVLIKTETMEKKKDDNAHAPAEEV